MKFQTIAPENESDDEEGDEDDDDDEGEEDEDESDDEESDIEDEDDLVENGDANEELRQAVEKALGDAAAKEDQEVTRFRRIILK